jgi:prepilin-type N-terminal cleavage/methylation domain-containing protein/prepilin-type processing-associated H-X9-DG protein
MVERKQRGFTLVELLVVIVIIGMLMALLLPAIGAAREAARRATCMNNQRNLATALIQYATNKDKFPGYNNAVPLQGITQNINASWSAVILPQLGRQDYYDSVFRSPVGGPQPFERIRGLLVGSQATPAYLEMFVCPSDPATTFTQGVTSYVANTGRLDKRTNNPQAPFDWVDNGIFHDHFLFAHEPAKASLNTMLRNASTVRLSDLARWDGAATTLLLSENIQAGLWCGLVGAVNLPDDMMESRIGMIWQPTVQPNDAQKINGRKDEGGDVAQNFDFVRPSSNHAGGVNAVMADGSTKWLSDEMDYLVYILIMTPNGKQCADPGTKPKVLGGNPRFINAVQNTPLSDGMFNQ